MTMDETYFAVNQANNALLKDDLGFLVQPSIVQRLSCNIEFHPLFGEEAGAGVPSDALKFLANCSAKALASSNGLILCRVTTINQVVDLFIINPVTRSCLPIPTPEEVRRCIDGDLKLIFRCDSTAFKIFLFYNSEWSSYLNCQIFSSEEGVWRSMESSFFVGPRNLRFDIPVYYNGAIHVISDCFPCFAKNSPYFRPYVVSINYDNGISRVLRLPKDAIRGYDDDTCCEMGIFRWGKVGSETQSMCLVVLRTFVFTIWVLTDYESSSWRIIKEARVDAMVGTMEQNPIVIGYNVLNGEYLVVVTKKKIYGYNLAHEKDMEIDEIGEHKCESSNVHIMPFSNTLRPCGTLSFSSYFVNATSSPDEEYAASSFKVMHYWKEFLQMPSLSLEEKPRVWFLVFAFILVSIGALLYQIYFSLF